MRSGNPRSRVRRVDGGRRQRNSAIPPHGHAIDGAQGPTERRVLVNHTAIQVRTGSVHTSGFRSRCKPSPHRRQAAIPPWRRPGARRPTGCPRPAHSPTVRPSSAGFGPFARRSGSGEQVPGAADPDLVRHSVERHRDLHALAQRGALEALLGPAAHARAAGWARARGLTRVSGFVPVLAAVARLVLILLP